MAGFVIGAVIVAAATGGSDSGDSAEPSATITATETVAGSGKPDSSPKPSDSASASEEHGDGDGIPGDGTFVVGTEAKPGTYRTAGPADDVIDNCYWARLKSTSGDVGDIIANGNTKGPATVTISPGDKAFQTTGCTDWKRVD
ncbi:hypothetical protein AB0I66_06535 [Streptomyces sp. NPDC050439]|uniref:hypothetical protein n=1 Tax=unclassified Streptomyces TaxID=2593676 RepID=UPI0034240980